MVNSILALVSMVICSGVAASGSQGQSLSLAGQDLHIVAPMMTICPDPMQDWSQAIMLDGGVSIQVGDNLLSGRSAVIWLQSQGTEQATYGVGEGYLARVYLEGDVTVKKGRKSRATPVQHFMVEGAEVLVTQFRVTGEVFASADSQEQTTTDFLADHEIYGRGLAAAQQIPSGPAVRASAMVPNVAETIASPASKPSKKPKTPSSVAIEKQLKQASAPKEPSSTVESEFPVHVSALWEPIPQVQRTLMPDGQEVYTASGRFYVWQKRADDQVIEFMADNVVIFSQPDSFSLEQQKGNQVGMGKIGSVYLSGNIVMTEGDRTVRADEIYYDFVNQRALVANASLRMFDEDRGLPIYLRAEMLGRVSKDIFEARDVQLTSSEFYLPQMSLNASKMVLLTGEALEQHYRLKKQKRDTPAQYEGHLVDVNARYGTVPFFSWSKMTTNFARPDLPLRRITAGNDDEFGTSVETTWHLARLLGLRDPKWLESDLLLDYYSKRGIGAGVSAEYETDDARGSLIGYVMNDRGTDDLSRDRKNIDPDKDVRGRFSFRHRQYLPDGL
jgi:hypothetical protein